MKSDFPPRGTQHIRPKFGTVRQRRRFSDLAFLPCLWTKWTLDGPTAPCVKTGMRSDARSASYGRFGNIASAEAHDGQEACVCGPNTLPAEGKTAGLADPRFPGPDGEQKRCPRRNDNHSGNEQSKLLQRERSNTGEGNQAPSLGTIFRLDPDRLMPGERRERA